MKIGDLVKGTWEDSLIGILIYIRINRFGRYYGKVHWSNGDSFTYTLVSLETVK